jgi:hypothetical protein
MVELAATKDEPKRLPDTRMKLIEYVTWVSLLVVSQAISQTTSETGSYQKQAAISETEGIVHIAANSPRPLAQTLDALRQKYGWGVDYEDPQLKPFNWWWIHTTEAITRDDLSCGGVRKVRSLLWAHKLATDRAEYRTSESSSTRP